MAFTHDHINAFVIVGGDSDFITLVEKLKQYDKKVFVVGGRAFTGQVMQKNCTEFIAYENVARDGQAVAQAARQAGGFRPDRGRQMGALSLEQAFPLVRRALKVLVDREVSPQLGLLKSTLLQLDSSFSERDYGASTFRDFAEKLEQRGFVTLKHQGRTTLVELSDQAVADEAQTAPVEGSTDGSGAPVPGEMPAAATASGDEPPLSLAEGVSLVRQVLAEATTPPRWPMYLRQMKQFIRAARPDFDERRYGSLPDLLRACQKDGLLRLERDRQGGLRAFAGSQRSSPVPHGWGTVSSLPQLDVELDESPAAIQEAATVVEAESVVVTEETIAAPAPIVTPGEEDTVDDDQLAMFGVVKPEDPDPVPVRTRARRSRKSGDSGDQPKRGRKAPASRTRSRRSPS
jgi:hypothetical protein